VRESRSRDLHLAVVGGRCYSADVAVPFVALFLSFAQGNAPPCAPGIPVTAVCPLQPTAYLPQDVAGTRSIGMGDAFRGVGTSNDTIVENPAGMVLNPHYEIAGFFGYGTQAPATYWNASVVDSLSLPPLSVGIAYNHLGSGTGMFRFTGWDLRLALALPISDVFAVGISGYFLDYQGALFRTLATTGDVAIGIHPNDQVTVALIGYNLVSVNSPLTPRQLGIGASIGTDLTYRVDVDVVTELDNNPHFDVHIGGEYFAGQLVAIRAGYSYLGLVGQNYGSVGLGLIVQGFSLEIAYRLELGQWNDNLLLAGMKFFFNS
jgi:hypothetical protein